MVRNFVNDSVFKDGEGMSYSVDHDLGLYCLFIQECSSIFKCIYMYSYKPGVLFLARRQTV